jgi:hypothetical protein
MGKKYLETKETSLESSILGVWQEAVKKEELSKKQKKLDVDGDGEIEGSDLAKLRKKGAKKEGNAFGMALKAAKDKGEKTFVVAGKKYDVQEESDLDEGFGVAEDIPAMELGTDRYRDYALDVTPGETDPEWVQARDFKVASMKEALAKVWGMDEKKLDKTSKEDYDEEDEELKPVPGSKTMTGGKVAKVDTKPKIG